MTTAWNPRLAALVAAGAILTLSGCSSIKSTIYDPDNCCGDNKRRLHGIPVTMDVPTHVKVTIVEKRYYRLPADAEGRAPLLPTTIPPTRHLEYDVVAVKELFTVDFKRPAAGTMDLQVAYDEKTSGGQYFSGITYNVEDLTIDKVSGLIQAIISSTPTLAGLGLPTAARDATLVEVPRVIAVEFFNARQPGLQARIQEFLERYVNACTEPCLGPACPAPIPPAVPPAAPHAATSPVAPGAPVAPPAARPTPAAPPVVIAEPPAPTVPAAPQAPPRPPVVVPEKASAPGSAAVGRLETLGRRR
jgi:hypothetical protein